MISEALLEAFELLEAESLEVRPGDLGSPVQVGVLSTQETDLGKINAVYVVSEFSNFVPIAFTNCENYAVGSALLALVARVNQGPAPEIGAVFDLVGSDELAAMDIAGLVLLKPNTLDALSGMADKFTSRDNVFEPRLVVFLGEDEVKLARVDFSALLDRFDELKRDVFLIR